MDNDRVEARLNIAVKSAIKDIKNVNNEVGSLSTNVSKLGKEIKGAFQTTGIIGWLGVIKKATNLMINASKNQTAYIENLHLLQTAYGEVDSSGEKLVKTMSNLSGFDPAQLTKSLAQFRQLSTALGITSEKASLLSENLLKMNSDIASLYNLSDEATQKKLMSALTGETKAIKILGADVTQTALQIQAYKLGITDSVTSMTQAEKTILRYLAVENQLKNSQGDLAKNINSVAIQTKIWQSQLAILGRQLGSVFIPILKSVLPILNGILIAFNTIIATLLGFFGINVENMVEPLTNDFVTLSDGIDGVAEASKSAKQSLRGFDKLNVIKTPTSTSAGSGSGLGGIRYTEMLDAISEYNNKLAEANNKAREIAKTILKWLGFTEDINGEFKFTGNLLDKIKIGALSTVGILLALLPVLKIIKTLKGLFGLSTGLTGSISSIKEIKNTAKEFQVPKATTILKGLGDLALIIGGITAIVVAIGELRKIQGFDEVVSGGIETLVEIFFGIAKILIPLAGLSVYLIALDKVGIKTYLSGLGKMASIIAITGTLVTAIGFLTSLGEVSSFVSGGVDTVVKIFDGLGKVAFEIAIFSALITALGFVSPKIITKGLIGFIEIIGVLGLVMAGIGALVTKHSNIIKWIETGGDVLSLIAEKIGAFAGAIIKGFLGKVFEGIADFGTQLSNFMTNAEPFFIGLKNVTSDSALAVKYLAESMLILTGNDIVDGLLGWLKGNNSLETFGEDLEAFAPYFVSYAKTIQNGNINADLITKTAYSAKALAEMSREVPNQGGLWGKLWGENDLKTFGENLEAFGESFSNYANSIKNVNSDVVTNSNSAIESLINLAKEIPNQGGFWAKLWGDNDFKQFGQNLESFGKSFANYYKYVKNIEVSTLNNVTNALVKIINAYKVVKENGLSSVVSNFSVALSNSALAITSAFSSNLSWSKGYDIGSNFGSGLSKGIINGIKSYTFPSIKLTDKKTYEKLADFKITAYKNGGFPTKGDLFLANEETPEYIGSINGKPAVANNDQIVEAISVGVAKAMLSTGGNKVNVNIVAEEDSNGLLNFIDFKQKQKDRQYGF